jgi:hypothetical protein
MAMRRKNPERQDTMWVAVSDMARRRCGRKASNRDWKTKTDTRARIARMKDGLTRPACKVENAMDLGSRITVAAEVHWIRTRAYATGYSTGC